MLDVRSNGIPSREDNRMVSGKKGTHKRHRPHAEGNERGRDSAMSEEKRNRLAAEANERFVRSGVRIRDMYGVIRKPRKPR